MASSRKGALAAIVAVGMLLGFTVGTAAVAQSHPHNADSDYADQIAQKQQERKELEAQAEAIQSALEDTAAEIVLADNQLKDLEARLPIAEAELAAAQAKLTEAEQNQRMVEERLTAAVAEDKRIAEQIATDAARLAEIKAMVAELARASYRGESAGSTLRLVLGAQSTEDFVDEYTAQHALLRTQGNALTEMEQIAAVNRNRGARQTAVRAYIEELKVLADKYVAEAEAARAEAEAKKKEIEALVAEQERLKALLEDQKAEYERQQAEIDSAYQQLKDDLAALIRAQRDADRQYGDGVWGYPTAHPYITSSYGWRLHPIFGVWRLHAGTDFRAYCGTPVLAAADGWVEWAKYRSGFGNQVLISHGYIDGNFYMSSYNHLSSWVVRAGDYVLRGDTIAYSGSTGSSTACHLHFEIYINGSTVDPMTILPPL